MSDNKVSVFSGEKFKGEWVPERLVDAIDWLNQKLEEVPAARREQATINIWAKPEETFQGIVNKLEIEYPAD